MAEIEAVGKYIVAQHEEREIDNSGMLMAATQQMLTVRSVGNEVSQVKAGDIIIVQPPHSDYLVQHMGANYYTIPEAAILAKEKNNG
jgi:hypothetical protein